MSVIIFLNMYSYSMFFINSIKNIYNNFNHKPSWTSKYHAFWQDNTSQIIENVVTNFSTKLPFLKKHFSFCKPEVQNNINATIVTTEDSANNKSELVLQNLTKEDIDKLTFEQVTVPVSGNNLLHQAALNNNLKFIEKIIRENLADTNKAYAIMEQPNNLGDTFLDIAYKNKNYSIIFEVAKILDNSNASQNHTVPDIYKHMTQAEYHIGLFLNRKYSVTQEPIDITKLWIPVEYKFYYQIHQDINFSTLIDTDQSSIIGDQLTLKD